MWSLSYDSYGVFPSKIHGFWLISTRFTHESHGIDSQFHYWCSFQNSSEFVKFEACCMHWQIKDSHPIFSHLRQTNLRSDLLSLPCEVGQPWLPIAELMNCLLCSNGAERRHFFSHPSLNLKCRDKKGGWELSAPETGGRGICHAPEPSKVLRNSSAGVVYGRVLRNPSAWRSNGFPLPLLLQ